MEYRQSIADFIAFFVATCSSRLFVAPRVSARP
jgi:hypothetical protein